MFLAARPVELCHSMPRHRKVGAGRMLADGLLGFGTVSGSEAEELYSVDFGSADLAASLHCAYGFLGKVTPDNQYPHGNAIAVGLFVEGLVCTHSIIFQGLCSPR